MLRIKHLPLALMMCCGIATFEPSFGAETIELKANSALNIEDPTQIHFQLVNQLRSQMGAGALRRSATLDRAAQIRARELESLYSHTRPNGTTPYTAMTELGYDYTTAAENIAYVSGYPDEGIGERFFQNWKNSPGHYRNMINGELQEIGIGFYKTGNKWYAVQLFGTPSGSSNNNNGNSWSNNGTTSSSPSNNGGNGVTPQNQGSQWIISNGGNGLTSQSQGSQQSSNNNNSSGQSSDEGYLTEYVDKVFWAVNLERANVVNYLDDNTQLNQAAAIRAKELASNFDHTRPDGREFVTVLEDVGFNCHTVSEHLAVMDASTEDPVQHALESLKEDTDLLMDGTNTHIASAFYRSGDRLYVVLIFAGAN